MYRTGITFMVHRGLKASFIPNLYLETAVVCLFYNSRWLYCLVLPEDCSGCNMRWLLFIPGHGLLSITYQLANIYCIPGGGYCLPVFLRCNGVYDCPGREDEDSCDSFTCPGFYRCRGSLTCLHPEQLCDGVYQCPQSEDELLCDFSCPENCTCYGLAFYCRHPFPAAHYPRLRFLDGRGSGMSGLELSSNTMLVHLSLASCGLRRVDELNFPNLHVLNLNDNQLREVYLSEFRRLPRLERLSVSGNPLVTLFSAPGDLTGVVMSALRILDLSRVDLKVLNVSFLSAMPELHIVNLSAAGVKLLQGEGFQSLRQLRVLDLRGCPVTHFPRDVFQGLDDLQAVYADNYKLCCPATLPSRFSAQNCHAPSNELSSCDALLRSVTYRVFLSVFAALSLVGNASSFVYRVFLEKGKKRLSFDVFVAHLCVADFLMGVYLAVIGVVDRLYQGTYLWEDNTWKDSAGCKVAGFLSLVSNEVSALVIALITIDRFLVLRFPFSDFRFEVHSAQVACFSVWSVGVLLAGLPLLSLTDDWQFYGQTGICIPLPVTRSDFPGHSYAFGVMIVANFVLFVVIAAGQFFIYWSIHVNTMSSDQTTRQSHDLTIARRLLTVAMSDFLCWFPIGLLGLLASSGTPIPGEVSVAMAIFVLPFNSALNPFLYTLNVVLEKRRRLEDERIEKRLLAQLRSPNSDAKTISSQGTR